MTAKKAAKSKKKAAKKAAKEKPVFVDTKAQLHTIPGAKALDLPKAAPVATPEAVPVAVPAKAVAPVKKVKKQTVEQLIASGEVDPDHFVKWGDLKDRLK